MFSVYGSSGRLFRGTLEQLRQVSPVHAVDRARAVEPVWRDELGADRGAPLSPHADAEHPRSREAMAAYARPRPPAGRRWTLTPVAKIMTREVLTLSDTDTVSRAWQLLDQKRFGQAPVVNADHVLVGMVTLAGLALLYTHSQFEERALARQFIAEQPLSACMSTPVPSVAAEADLLRVASLLLESALPGLPVVDEEGRVTGFISRTDILRAVLDDSSIDQWS